jgi:hypothetical protein
MSTYPLPTDTAAVLSTYAVEMLPDYDDLIARPAAELSPGGRLVINGLRDPERWPVGYPSGSAITRPFGVTAAWESISTHTINIIHVEAVAGAVYVAAGTAP